MLTYSIVHREPVTPGFLLASEFNLVGAGIAHLPHLHAPLEEIVVVVQVLLEEDGIVGLFLAKTQPSLNVHVRQVEMAFVDNSVDQTGRVVINGVARVLHVRRLLLTVHAGVKFVSLATDVAGA